MTGPTAIPLRHGYSTADLDNIARFAVSRNSQYHAVDPDERYAAAWHAAAEHLCAAAEPPARRDLVNAAWNAANIITRRYLADRGTPRAGGTKLPRFHAYWYTASRPTLSPEAGIVEAVALRQVWACLWPVDREALTALALHDDYRAAAASLGLEYYAFCQRIRRARGRFMQLWLEGETPRKAWRDQRSKRGPGPRDNVSAFIRSRRRRATA